MMLKPRTRPTTYVTVEADLKLLSNQHKYYLETFTAHPIFSGGNYGNEILAIENEWVGKEPKGQRTKQTDIADLWTAVCFIKSQETLYRALLHQSFRKIYSYIFELIQDWEIGYLEDSQFFRYMHEYKSAIEKNKACHLDAWDKVGHAEIEKQIAPSKN